MKKGDRIVTRIGDGDRLVMKEGDRLVTAQYERKQRR